MFVPLVGAMIWVMVAPLLVLASDPRLRRRNPDHFARLVRISRTWGILACFLGFVIARLL